MKVYTKKGDTGKTQLLGGSVISKNHIRLECYGSIDELNAFIGNLYDQDLKEHHKSILLYVQNQLFNLGSIISFNGKKQNIKFNIELSYTNKKAQNDKDIKSIVDYGKITKVIKNLTKNKHYNFLESLAEDIFDVLFKDKRINQILLRIEKINILKETKSVGIEIIKKRTHV